MGKCFLLFYLILIILFVPFVHANVKINEFAIDQTPQGAELINTASTSADISNWYIDDSSGTTYFTIPQNTIIYPHSCLVFTGEFNLNKSTPDTIRLFDSTAPPTTTSAALIDSYSYKSSPGPGKSYVRSLDGTDTWSNGFSTLGQYNETGINCIIMPTPTPTLTPTPSPTDIPTPSPTNPPPTSTLPTSYNNILISEVMIYPLPDQNEWIELFNNNSFDVSLTNWYIDDVENGGTTPKRFSLNIPSYSFATIDLNSSIFNNDNDSVRLLDFDKIQKDGFEYNQTTQNKSLGRTSWESDYFCIQEPSKNIANNLCLQETLISFVSSSYSSISSSHTKSVPTSVYVTPSSVYSVNANPTKPMILGVSTLIQKSQPDQPKQNNTAVNHLSFLSASYSFLTIISLLFKIRNGSV